MKMTQPHYQHLHDTIIGFLQSRNHTPQSAYQHYATHNIGKDTEKRCRWDCVSGAKLSPWVCDNLYPYLNDDHIDTALRKIFTMPTKQRI